MWFTSLIRHRREAKRGSLSFCTKIIARQHQKLRGERDLLRTKSKVFVFGIAFPKVVLFFSAVCFSVNHSAHISLSLIFIGLHNTKEQIKHKCFSPRRWQQLTLKALLCSQLPYGVRAFE